MKKLILLLLLFIPIVSIGQGIIPISSEEYEKESFLKIDNRLGFSEPIPDNYSLEKFVPLYMLTRTPPLKRKPILFEKGRAN